jgi:hypothetical protein
MAAIRPGQTLLDLCELEIDRCGATENQYRNLDATLVVIDVFDDTIEVGEWTVDDANHLARLVEHLGAWLLATFLQSAPGWPRPARPGSAPGDHPFHR